MNLDVEDIILYPESFLGLSDESTIDDTINLLGDYDQRNDYENCTELYWDEVCINFEKEEGIDTISYIDVELSEDFKKKCKISDSQGHILIQKKNGLIKTFTLFKL